MKIVFFGSSQFAAPSLRALINSGHKLLCVVTQPDRHKGRHLNLSGTVIKSVAQGAHLTVYQPENVNTAVSLNFLKGLKPDLFAVVSYGQLLSAKILSIPKIFSINAHASLLPKYRGAAPINWAIMNAEGKTGVTIIKLTSQMDAGPVILQEPVDISGEDTDISLSLRLCEIANRLLLKALNSIEEDNYKLTPQEEDKASFAPKLKREDGLINWGRHASDIYNLIRGVTRWPGAFTYYNGRLFKIYKAKVIAISDGQVVREPGEITKIDKNGITAATGKDGLMIEELQIEGKIRMRAEEFVLGHKISVGEKFGRKN